MRSADSYSSRHPVTCLQDGCLASFPGSKHDTMRATQEGWFFPKDQQGLKGWCPAHVPGWVAAWRAQQAARR
jgi:hypothetical protein